MVKISWYYTGFIHWELYVFRTGYLLHGMPSSVRSLLPHHWHVKELHKYLCQWLRFSESLFLYWNIYERMPSPSLKNLMTWCLVSRKTTPLLVQKVSFTLSWHGCVVCCCSYSKVSGFWKRRDAGGDKEALREVVGEIPADQSSTVQMTWFTWNEIKEETTILC